MSEQSIEAALSSSGTSDASPTRISTNPTASNICSICDNLFHIRRPGHYTLEPIYYHHTIANLEKSAQVCEVCALFQSQITESTLVEGQEHIDKPLSCLITPSTLHYSAYCQIDTEVPVLDERTPTNTDSPGTIALAKSWLRSCRETHEECVSAAEYLSSTPSRILSIGLSDSNPIHLYTDDLPPNTPYATLSHCWGCHHFIRLTQKNFESFKKSIPFSSLPKTFRDAIEVARQLGFAYIWIDSLCIIQGDREDWYNESSRMSSIYGRSGLNISASGAYHGNEGLFFERNPAFVRRLLVYVDPRTSEEPRDPAEDSRDNAKRKLFYACHGQIYKHCFVDQAICDRAWVFQERYLAPRTLHFGNSQIFWECYTSGCAFETLPRGMPDDICLPTSTVMQWEKMKGFEDGWRGVVSEYSRGKLTRGSDKSVAILGVARAFGVKYGGHYYHGLWSEHFPQTLCWYGERRVTRSWIRPGNLPQIPGREKRAPTWSWISVDGPIWLRDGEMRSSSSAIVKIEGPDNLYSHDPDGLITLEVERLLEVTELFHYELEYDWNMDHFSASVTGVGESSWNIICTFDHYDEDGSFLIPSVFYMLDMMERYEGAGIGILVMPVKGKKGFLRRIGTYLTSEPTFTAFKEAREKRSEQDETELRLYRRRGKAKGNGTQTYIVTLE